VGFFLGTSTSVLNSDYFEAFGCSDLDLCFFSSSFFSKVDSKRGLGISDSETVSSITGVFDFFLALEILSSSLVSSIPSSKAADLAFWLLAADFN
jgi:hypothetical protein